MSLPPALADHLTACMKRGVEEAGKEAGEQWEREREQRRQQNIAEAAIGRAGGRSAVGGRSSRGRG